jgi:hypothetical protein
MTETTALHNHTTAALLCLTLALALALALALTLTCPLGRTAALLFQPQHCTNAAPQHYSLPQHLFNCSTATQSFRLQHSLFDRNTAAPSLIYWH